MIKAQPFIGVIIAASLVAVVWSGLRVRHAHSAASESQARYERLCGDAPQLDRLRLAVASHPTSLVEQINLVGDINSVLVDAGIPVSALVNLTPDAQVPAVGNPNQRGATYRRQIARLTFEQVTLPQVGKFLSSWRLTHPRWTVSSIQVQPMPLSPEGAKKQNGAVDLQQPLRLYLVIESTYLEKPPESPRI